MGFGDTSTFVFLLDTQIFFGCIESICINEFLSSINEFLCILKIWYYIFNFL